MGRHTNKGSIRKRKAGAGKKAKEYRAFKPTHKIFAYEVKMKKAESEGEAGESTKKRGKYLGQTSVRLNDVIDGQYIGRDGKEVVPGEFDKIAEIKKVHNGKKWIYKAELVA